MQPTEEQTQAPVSNELVNPSPVAESSAVEISSTAQSEPTVEEQARKSGWTSKEEWVAAGKDPSKWRDAENYLDRGSFFERIESLNQKIKQQQAMLDSVTSTLSKAEERAYKKALDELNAQKATAWNHGDRDAYEKALKEEQEIHSQMASGVNVKPSNQLSIEEIKKTDYWQRFEAQNPWVHETDELARTKQFYATQLASKLEADGLPHADILDKVSRQVTQQFGGNVLSKNSPVTVGATSRPVTSVESPLDMNRLNPHQVNMLRYLEAKPDKTLYNNFIKALKDELKDKSTR